jgi:hypothetical protein
MIRGELIAQGNAAVRMLFFYGIPNCYYFIYLVAKSDRQRFSLPLIPVSTCA